MSGEQRWTLRQYKGLSYTVEVVEGPGIEDGEGSIEVMPVSEHGALRDAAQAVVDLYENLYPTRRLGVLKDVLAAPTQ